VETVHLCEAYIFGKLTCVPPAGAYAVDDDDGRLQPFITSGLPLATNIKTSPNAPLLITYGAKDHAGELPYHDAASSQYLALGGSPCSLCNARPQPKLFSYCPLCALVCRFLGAQDLQHVS
jgi:hypothetical protein